MSILFLVLKHLTGLTFQLGVFEFLSQSIAEMTVNVTLTTQVTAAAILHSKPFDGDSLFLQVKPFGFSDVAMSILNFEVTTEAPDKVKQAHSTVN